MPTDVLLRFAGRKARLVGLDENDHITKTIKESGAFYEIELLSEIFHRAMPDWVFVDAGAHIGNHTVFLGAILGLEGYAIEQNPETFARLSSNIAANELEGRVRPINVAVGRDFARASGIGESSEHNSGSRMVALDPKGDIEVLPLNSLQLDRLDLLKIDVEGFEIACIEGAAMTIMRHRPLICAEAINRQNFDELVARLARMGYRPTRRYNVTPTYFFEAS